MPKPKKNSSTSKKGQRGKKGRPRGRTVKLDVSDYHGQDTKLLVHNDEGPDFEKVAGDPTDEAAKHKFPPPRKNPEFRKVWMQFIDMVTGKDTFKEAHLTALAVLCDLYVEYEELRGFIRRHGRTYKSVGRTGLQFKFYPEVEQLNKVQNQIQGYMKMLGLALKDAKEDGSGSDGEKGEWD